MCDRCGCLRKAIAFASHRRAPLNKVEPQMATPLRDLGAAHVGYAIVRDRGRAILIRATANDSRFVERSVA